MNIKTRLAVQFTLMVAGILLFSSGLVYYFSDSSLTGKFRETLYDRAQTVAILYINVAEVDSSLLKRIHESTVSLFMEEIVITDSARNIIYKYKNRYLTPASVSDIPAYRVKSFYSIREKDGICFRHFFNNRNYYVFVMAYDVSRVIYLADLERILFWSILTSLLVSVLLSYIFSRKAIEPIARIIESVKEINSKKLSSRLAEGNKRDEIARLAITFNEMLSNLEIAFRNQDEFVSNASHELRTPVSVMISESDYILAHKREPEEYIKHLTGLIEDLKQFNSLLNSLLELAQLNTEKDLVFSELRIDEVVFTVISQIKSKYLGRKIYTRIDYPENGNDLLVRGNQGMLEIAFRNLIDNACKFSNDDVNIGFDIGDESISVIIADKGIGIPSVDLENINKPFSRASNVKYIGGFGIGLTLVTRIISLHDAGFNIDSTESVGTSVELSFKRIQKKE